MGNCDGGRYEAVGDGDGSCESGIGGDGFEKVELGAREGAKGGRIGWAGNAVEGWEADEGGEGDPVAWDAFGGDGAEAEWAEGGGAEGLEGVEGAEDGVGVLEDEGAGGEGELGAEGLVGVGDLYFGVAREGCGGFEREGQLLADGEVFVASEADGGIGGVTHVAAEKGEVRPGEAYGDGEDDVAAVVERDGGAELFSGFESGSGGGVGEAKAESGLGVGGWLVCGGGRGRRGEGKVIDL